MTDIVVISGFLGSGKTTLIQRYIQAYTQEEPVIIIENDFGEASIDQEALRSTKTLVSALNNGCICCSLGENLVESLERLIEKYRPSRIILEPSGVATLSEVLLNLNHPHLSVSSRIAQVITVVDAYRYQMYLENFDDFYENQIEFADTLVLTHQDLCAKPMDPSVFTQPSIFQSHELTASMCLELFEQVTHQSKWVTKTKTTMKLVTLTLQLPEHLTTTQWQEFLEWLHQYYEIVRMKGNIYLDGDVFQVQYTWSQMSCEPTALSPSGLVIIGHGVDRVIELWFQRNVLSEIDA